MAAIQVQNLRKMFGDFVAVQESSFTVTNGEFFVMLGPSGCGKTTTLRMIAGLEMPTSGKILLDGEDVTSNRASYRDIAFMFQMFALYPHMNVRKNIGFPLKCQGMRRSEIRRRVEETATLLRIDHILNGRLSGLSGGDRQRVALGRAIIRRPKAFLMDEPLGALDTEFRELMCGELRTLHDRLDATTIYVTHDQLEAMSLADRIMVMNNGLIEQVGSPQEIYDRPASMFVADFIGNPPMSFLRFSSAIQPGQGQVGVNGTVVPVPVFHEERPEGELALGIRPEHVSFSDSGALRGAVFETEYLGTTQIVTIDTDHGRIKARVPSALNVSPGENIGLELNSKRLVVFEADAGRALQSDLHAQAAHG